MSKFLRWSVLAIALVLVLGALVYKHYVLDSQKLDAAIKAELPLGTPKAVVIQFIQARKPLYWGNEGAHVWARFVGRAPNLIYRKDIVFDFEFDTNGKLLSFSKKVYLTFI
jgi:hypothetical protein